MHLEPNTMSGAMDEVLTITCCLDYISSFLVYPAACLTWFYCITTSVISLLNNQVDRLQLRI